MRGPPPPLTAVKSSPVLAGPLDTSAQEVTLFSILEAGAWKDVCFGYTLFPSQLVVCWGIYLTGGRLEPSIKMEIVTSEKYRDLAGVRERRCGCVCWSRGMGFDFNM